MANMSLGEKSRTACPLVCPEELAKSTVTKRCSSSIRFLARSFLFLIGCAVAVGAFGAEDREREILIRQMEAKYAGYTNTIFTLQAENREIAADRRAFVKAYSEITVPEFLVKTNVVRLSRKATMTTVVTNSFRQESRVRKLAKAMKDKTINRIYEKYRGEDCTALFDEFIAEWKEAEAGFADTKKKLAAGDKVYRREVDSINQETKREHEAQIAEIDEEINRLKRERGALLRERGFQVSPELNAQIRALEERKRTAQQIYRNNKYAASLAAAGSRKTDSGDMVLAQADLRDQHQNIYMTYYGKLRSDLLGGMDAKIEANETLIKSLKNELKRIWTLLQNRDMINVDTAKAIVGKQIDDALGGEFGINNTTTRERKAEEEEQEYQKGLKRKKDAQDLAEAEARQKEEAEERAYERKRRRDLDALDQEERKHAMEVERATRDVRIKEAQKEAEDRRRRRQREEEQDDLDRAALRRLIDAEAKSRSR